MIWFGDRLLPGAPVAARLSDLERMELGLRWVAERAPALQGGELVRALAGTGWVDEATASRLLPLFRGFDADRYFAERLRSLSFRGPAVTEEFRNRMGQVLVDVVGRREDVLADPAVEALRFRVGEREGMLFAFPEVGCSPARRLGEALDRVRDSFPHTVVVVARSFGTHAAAELRGALDESEIATATVPVNRMLGLRAVILRYRPDPERVMDTLCAGPIGSREVARLGD